jgi:hypothetical protein
LLWAAAPSAPAPSTKYQINAGYLYNLTKFISWHEDINKSFNTLNPFNICSVGVKPFGKLINPILQPPISGRPIKWFEFDKLQSIPQELHCHILYISSSIKDTLVGRNFDNTLTVGEGVDFISQGGMIAFIEKQGKIKLQCDPERINQAGLKISNKLLEVCL